MCKSLIRYLCVLVLNITLDDKILELYIDGVVVPNLPNRNWYKGADSVPLPPMAQVIAAKQSNALGNGGLLASSKFIISDQRWKVTTIDTNGWMNVTFDDSAWENATVYDLNNLNLTAYVPGISSSSAWIATKYSWESVVYYRYRINYCDLIM